MKCTGKTKKGLVPVFWVTAWMLFLDLTKLSGGIPGYCRTLAGAHKHMPETLFSLSTCDSLSAFHPTQHTAAYIQLTHEEILHKKQKTVAPQKKNKKRITLTMGPAAQCQTFWKKEKR